jgi:asparagine synthase (glutamine-hydrolysing)
MVGIVGFTKFNHVARLNSPLIAMTKSITIGIHQQACFYSNKFMEVACVSLRNCNFCFEFHSEDGTIGAIVYGKVLGNAINPAEHLIQIYKRYGKKALSKLNGSFCGVIFENTATPKVILITDRFGSRPLYYAFKDGEIIFSSHAKGILSYPFPKKLNERTLVKFLLYGKIGILGDDTWFEGIKLLPPASVLTFFSDGKYMIEKYWGLEYVSELSKKDAIESLCKAFKEAVNEMVSNANDNLAVLLSGGLDSRAILAALSTKNRRRITAVTFGVKGCDDILIAQKVTAKLRLKHIIIEYDPDELSKYAEKVVYLSEGQDTVNASFIPYVAEQMNRKELSCYLQGFMFDLLLGGSFLSKEFFKDNGFITALEKKSKLFEPKEIKELLNERLLHLVPSVRKEFIELAKESKGDSTANKVDYFFINTRVRRYTLMGSVINREFWEEMLPTIDNKVIEVIRKIPPELRFNHYLYREFLIRLNPDLSKIPYQAILIPPIFPHMLWRLGYPLLILNRIAKGKLIKHTYFNFDEILRTSNNWKKLVMETLLNDESLAYKLGYLKKDFVKNLLKAHYSGKNYGEKLAFLITFELFLRVFFQSK